MCVCVTVDVPLSHSTPINDSGAQEIKRDAENLLIFSSCVVAKATCGHYFLHWPQSPRRLQQEEHLTPQVPLQNYALECFHWVNVAWLFPVLRSASTGCYKKWSPQRTQRTHWLPNLDPERWRETMEDGMRGNRAWLNWKCVVETKKERDIKQTACEKKKDKGWRVMM